MARKTRVSKQTNGIDADMAKAFIERIENLEGQIDSERGSYMQKAKTIREDIKEVIIEAKDEGIPSKALKAMVKDRRYDRKKAELAAGLDIDEGAAFEQMKEALGPLADTPLGEAALGADPKPLGEAEAVH
ncbi:MAG: DUF2312 domain-containing protein [Hyphomicrobiales bacterium]|nr:DUF2312 domain-containing protein [Hyphomicrobiales bacterium]